MRQPCGTFCCLWGGTFCCLWAGVDVRMAGQAGDVRLCHV